MSNENMSDKQEQKKDGSNGAPDASATAQGPEDSQAQAEKYKNEFLYLRADFENYKRNAIKERSDMVKYGSERLLIEILGAIDNFERALEVKVTPETMDTFLKGVQMTAAELKAIVGRHGVTEIKTEGVPFDPMVHEALGAEAVEGVPSGHIARVYKRAYKLYDRVLRPAQVIVAK